MASRKRVGKLKNGMAHGRPAARLFTLFAHRPVRLASYSYAMKNFDAANPLVSFDGIPEAERDAAGQVFTLLVLLNYYVRCFEAAVQLYEFAAEQIAQSNTVLSTNPGDTAADESLEVFDGWPVIAGRDGAMSVYHFECTLTGLNDTMHLCPSLDTDLRRLTRKQAGKKLQEAFPNIVDARNATAHSGDKARTAVKTDEHGFLGEWSNEQLTFQQSLGIGQIILIDVLKNRQYTNTWQKKVVSYNIDIEGVKILAEVRDCIYSAFSADEHQSSL